MCLVLLGAYILRCLVMNAGVNTLSDNVFFVHYGGDEKSHTRHSISLDFTLSSLI